ncbi:DedA family protein [Vibrio vulnificus]|uniref:DedA family protein n=1 Tax=Vibrio vulnificus TaxID=672 RepID=UPI0009B6C6DF|nr:DedA family protein [Vibrio vulnificus]OQK36343.1 putative membrane-associated protein [Vibrio vulnificus]OQK50470.1 putative membrane-associated protein [Vibrio vulnificus]OQK61007.1 putative membrane-associated protein [Vibrio vulnificus]OQK63789.1 putative membrane-associated protein [Vibrio vulnificus]POC23520.1 DedA family protein [Vibrio vulnificus]
MEFFTALITSDFDVIQNSKYLLIILTAILFLESAFVFLPLPGDSLVIFSGGMVALGVLPVTESIILLTLAASLGGLVAYWQGFLLRQSRAHRSLEGILPNGTLERATTLLMKYGFLSLFVSRFIPFVRVLTPMMMGVNRLNAIKVFFSNLSSSLLWVALLLLIGKFTLLNPMLENYQAILIKGLVGVSLTLMFITLFGIVIRYFNQR